MPKAGAAYSFRVSLYKSGALIDSPTLAAGDVVVVKADDSAANITTLPSVTSSNSGVLNVALSASEMAGSAGGNVSVKFEDQSGDEWEPVTIDLELTGSDIDTVDGIVDSILVDTAEIGAAGAGLTEAGGTGDHLTALSVADIATAALAKFANVDTGETSAADGSVAELAQGAASLTAADIWSYATRTLTANVNGVTIVSAVSGSTIQVYEYDTWSFTVVDSNLSLGDYDNLIFVVKKRAADTDDDAILLADITTGLKRIGQAAPTAANLATVAAVGTTGFSLLLAMSEVAAKIGSSFRGSCTWWLKGIDTNDNPDQGFTLATGQFTIAGAGARQVA